MSSKSSRRLGQKILGQHVPELRQSKFYQEDFIPVLDETVRTLDKRSIEHIICYGLGSFHSGIETASRYQLALLILMHERLIELKSPLSSVIEIYDPSFEPSDMEILRSFSGIKFILIGDNEYCARAVGSESKDRATLVYMPHLDKYLYNNLLGANWNVRNLRALVILGNSFRAMIDCEIASKVKSDLYYMNLLVSNFVAGTASRKRNKKVNSADESSSRSAKVALIELKVDANDSDYWDIFNNFAFHIFDESWLRDNRQKIDQYRLNEWEKATTDDNERFFDQDKRCE